MKQAVILAGGKGTRLAERLGGRPKPLVDVCGVPLLERQVRELTRFGIDDIVLLVNHGSDQIAAFFAGRSDLGCRISLIDEGVAAGTAGATLSCLDDLADRFLMIYGDTLFNIRIDRFIAAHLTAKADATLLLHPNDHPHDSDLVECDASGRITRFHSYPHEEGRWLPNLVNAAFYAVEKRALRDWQDFSRPSDFAKDLFPAMVDAGAHLHGYCSFEYIKDLGTPKRLDKVEQHLRTGRVARASLEVKQAVVFLDRDGTLNVQNGFVRTPDELELLPGAEFAVKAWNDAEYRVALVTNQPVIARGECSLTTLREIHAKLETLLGVHGAYIDALEYCPHHPDRGFAGEIEDLKVTCLCRKPGTLMLERAATLLNADIARSWMVGDSTADIMAGARIGARTVLVGTGSGGQDGKYGIQPDFSVKNVLEASQLITVLAPRMATQAASLIDIIEPGALIVIGGLARSGKSTLAAWIASEIRRRGMGCSVLSLDSWIRPADLRKPGVLGRFDLEKAKATVAPWLAGASIDVVAPTYDRMRRQEGTPIQLSVSDRDAFIIEGVPALALDFRASSRSIHTVFLDGNEQLRAERVITDMVERGVADRVGAESEFQLREQDEHDFVRALRSRASYSVSLDENC
jgi:histidinol-phosphate phosphatase family protein